MRPARNVKSALASFILPLISSLVRGLLAALIGLAGFASLVALSCIIAPCASAAECPQCSSPVSMELRDAGIREFLEGVSKAYNINMIIADGVEGTVSASLKDVPLTEAMDSVLESRGFVRRTRGSSQGALMVIEPGGASMQAERSLMMREFRLTYAKADEQLAAALREVISKEGKVSLITGSNSIVVKDIPLGIERASGLLASIDRKPGQVSIEARIIEISRSAGRTLGINWGGRYHRTSGNVFGGIGSVDGDFSVNLPGAEDAAGVFGLAVVSDRVSLDLRLTALETSGQARTVSAPSVSVRENHRAVIAEGTRILVPKTLAATIIKTGETTSADERAETFDALMELSVMPRITSPDSIALSLNVRREWFDYSAMVEGFPLKLTKSAATEVVLKSGESLAVGGVTVDASEESRREVPLLGRIPLIGALFRGKSSSQEHRELLIILTPKVMEESDEGDNKNPQG